MNRENILKSGSYEAIAKVAWTSKWHVKNSFNRRWLDINNSEHISLFLEERSLRVPWIYIIENKRTWKKYVWQSENILLRHKNHMSLLRNWKHNIKEMQEDFDLFWEDSFSIFILEKVCDDNERIKKEDAAIDSYNYDLLYNRQSNKRNMVLYAKLSKLKNKYFWEIMGFLESLE